MPAPGSPYFLSFLPSFFLPIFQDLVESLLPALTCRIMFSNLLMGKPRHREAEALARSWQEAESGFQEGLGTPDCSPCPCPGSLSETDPASALLELSPSLGTRVTVCVQGGLYSSCYTRAERSGCRAGHLGPWEEGERGRCRPGTSSALPLPTHTHAH